MNSVRLWLFITAFLLSGCAGRESDDASAELKVEFESRMLVLSDHLAGASSSTGEDAGRLIVRLAFGGDVDLDLYVTDPQLETVYFANHQSKSGGEIAGDRRCSDPGNDEAIKVEEVRFAVPQAGRYRVGVDYPAHCSGLLDPAAHGVRVSFGGEHLETHGQVELQIFDVIVLEFEFDGTTLKELER